MTSRFETLPLNVDPRELSGRLLRLALENGKPMRLGGAPCEGASGECWTNSWQARDQPYCEGAVRLPSGKWSTHAWTLSPFGTVVERTPGYADGLEWRGFVIDRLSPLAAATRGWTGWRSSILEAALANVAPETLLALLGVRS